MKELTFHCYIECKYCLVPSFINCTVCYRCCSYTKGGSRFMTWSHCKGARVIRHSWLCPRDESSRLAEVSVDMNIRGRFRKNTSFIIWYGTENRKSVFLINLLVKNTFWLIECTLRAYVLFGIIKWLLSITF